MNYLKQSYLINERFLFLVNANNYFSVLWKESSHSIDMLKRKQMESGHNTECSYKKSQFHGYIIIIYNIFSYLYQRL